MGAVEILVDVAIGAMEMTSFVDGTMSEYRTLIGSILSR